MVTSVRAQDTGYRRRAFRNLRHRLGERPTPSSLSSGAVQNARRGRHWCILLHKQGGAHALPVEEGGWIPDLCRRRHQHGLVRDRFCRRQYHGTARLRRRARRPERERTLLRLRIQGLSLRDPQSGRKDHRDDLRSPRPELHLGRFHGEGRSPRPVPVPPAQGQTQEARSPGSTHLDHRRDGAIVEQARARRLLQSRRRQQPGLCATVSESNPRPDQGPGETETSAGMAIPQARRGHPRLHQGGDDGRHPARLLL